MRELFLRSLLQPQQWAGQGPKKEKQSQSPALKS
jgi:hypothetical protein